VHGGVLGRLEHGLGRGQQRFHIALDVVEVDLGFCPAPLQLVGSAVGQTRHAHGLVKALDGGVGVDHGLVLEEHAAQLEHAHALGLAVHVELQHLQQRAQQRRAHHAQMAGDGVEQLDGVVVAGQLLLPLFFDKAEVDGFLVAQARQFVAHGKGCARSRRAAWARSGPAAWWSAGFRSRSCGPLLRSDLLPD
jgi:hypothetical protein